jgi:hypothetical protein
MSILSFLNTVYDTAQHSQRYGGPKTLIQGDSKYDYNTLRYPLDIGNYDKGHYMVIHINQQTRSQFDVGGFANEDPTVISNMKKLIEKRGQVNLGGVADTARGVIGDTSNAAKSVYTSQYARGIATNVQNFIDKSKLGQSFDWADNKLTNLKSQYSGISGITSFISGGVGEFKSGIDSINGVNFLRTIRRTTDSITLYMPDTLNFQYQQSYDELNLPIGGLLGAGTSLYESVKNGDAEKMGKNLVPFLAAGAAGALGDYGRALVASGFGAVENPMIELLYSRPNLRNFQFDFMLYPRDEKEALEVQNILDRLRFHQAPEIKSDTGGYFLIPPSEFDIKFYYNGQINPNIDPISTCVLEQIIVNYSPLGPFSAYESVNQGRPSLGGTGMPVVIQLTLMFKETQILTKDNFNDKLKYGDRLSDVTTSQPQEDTPVAQAFKVDLRNPEARNIMSDEATQRVLQSEFRSSIAARMSDTARLD